MTDIPKPLREMPRDEAIAIFEHWLDTGETCQYSSGKWVNDPSGKWVNGAAATLTDWCPYRLPVTYPTVDWSHVADWVNYIGFDADGKSFASNFEPTRYNNYWSHEQCSKVFSADTIASLTRGTCDWRDSLICRPGVEGEQ